MKSVLARRAAAGAVVALTAATLSIGAVGTAHADTSVTDLQGTVTGADGGADVWVYVEDAATNGGVLSESTVTDGSGHYSFTDLEFTGPVKIEFGDESSFDLTTTSYYLERWYGGSRYESGATQVALVQDIASTVNMTMSQAGIVAGSVAALDGHALTSYWEAEVVNTDDEWNGVTEGDSDATHFRYAVEPGTYRFGGYGSDGTSASYLESWWHNADTLSSATPVAVGSGQLVSGIDIRLTDKLSSRQAPSIVGIPAVGRPLTATPGTWNRNAGTEFSYAWMRGATLVGAGQTYVPTAADFGQRLNVVVTALNGSNAGQAASAQSDVVRYPADAKGKAKALAGHKVRFATKIVSAKQSPVKGKVVVLRGSHRVHKAVKLVKGKAVIVVKHQPKGKQTYTVVYKGNSVLAKATKTFTVRVH
jgi:hypothetical protein